MPAEVDIVHGGHDWVKVQHLGGLVELFKKMRPVHAPWISRHEFGETVTGWIPTLGPTTDGQVIGVSAPDHPEQRKCPEQHHVSAAVHVGEFTTLQVLHVHGSGKADESVSLERFAPPWHGND